MDKWADRGPFVTIRVMSDSERRPVESPCIRRCTLDEQDVCIGCFRSLDEILAWSKASDDRRREILRRTQERRLEATSPAVGRPETTDTVRRIKR